jgi:homoserine kinase
MKQPFQDSPRDNTGAIILGNQHQGCPYCNTIEVHYSTNGKIAWYHPGTTCCKQATQRQITWRTQELQELRRQITDQQNKINALQTQTQDLTGKNKQDAIQELNRQTAHLQRLTHNNTLKAKGDPTTNTIGLQQELDELKQKQQQQ